MGRHEARHHVRKGSELYNSPTKKAPPHSGGGNRVRGRTVGDHAGRAGGGGCFARAAPTDLKSRACGHLARIASQSPLAIPAILVLPANSAVVLGTHGRIAIVVRNRREIRARRQSPRWRSGQLHRIDRRRRRTAPEQHHETHKAPHGRPPIRLSRSRADSGRSQTNDVSRGTDGTPFTASAATRTRSFPAWA